ncbi:GtrA family protein [Corynebacterium choanae]|uniref:GtrA-like protein n=1 Tax=Corynebacterium choanae TaxID=1862358 RepID=A0A3G6J826_9CORY|nr:GtrA family protein [Corynebacterium choanae]AZA14255.1 GtrA-like protein [Corynebacterium choanae]
MAHSTLSTAPDSVPEYYFGRIPRTLVRKIVNFTLVGVVGAVCDYGSRFVMLALGVPPFVARGGSYIVGSTVAYYLNSFFTFSGDRSAKEKSRAAVSYVVCFCLAVLVDAAVRHGVPQLPYLYTWSWVASQAVATITNFLLQNLWVFQAGKAQPKPAHS